ncbi:MAG: hypothetical protein Q9190_000470 [Brigantiaea leucoxantha]
MRSLGQNPTETELQDMINEVDVDGTGTIDLQEFVTMMKMDVGEPDKEAELAQIFRIFDKDNSGSISASELRDAMRAIGQNYTDEEFEEMMDEVDLDRNGTIDCKCPPPGGEAMRGGASLMKKLFAVKEFLQLMDHK